ncbi:hypothetical protein HK098_001252 [Nowakowskiella sp. JEL0407]|nr:hypothetical protein HK098_001252 [Nowakowskiella sp. JEL0407]
MATRTVPLALTTTIARVLPTVTTVAPIDVATAVNTDIVTVTRPSPFQNPTTTLSSVPSNAGSQNILATPDPSLSTFSPAQLNFLLDNGIKISALTISVITLVLFFAIIANRKKKWITVVWLTLPALLCSFFAILTKVTEGRIVFVDANTTHVFYGSLEHGFLSVSSILYAWALFFQIWRIMPFSKTTTKLIITIIIGLISAVVLVEVSLFEYVAIQGTNGLTAPPYDTIWALVQIGAPYFGVLFPALQLALVIYLIWKYYIPRLQAISWISAVPKFWGCGAGIILLSELAGFVSPFLVLIQSLPSGVVFLILAVRFLMFMLFLICTFHSNNDTFELPEFRLVRESALPKRMSRKSGLAPAEDMFGSNEKLVVPEEAHQYYKEKTLSSPRVYKAGIASEVPSSPAWVREARQYEVKKDSRDFGKKDWDAETSYDPDYQKRKDEEFVREYNERNRYSINAPSQMFDPPKKPANEKADTTIASAVGSLFTGGFWSGAKKDKTETTTTSDRKDSDSVWSGRRRANTKGTSDYDSYHQDSRRYEDDREQRSREYRKNIREQRERYDRDESTHRAPDILERGASRNHTYNRRPEYYETRSQSRR